MSVMTPRLNAAVSCWVDRRPGPFTGRTPTEVWTAARQNFYKHGVDCSMLEFMMAASAVGYDALPLAIGGYTLARVRR